MTDEVWEPWTLIVGQRVRIRLSPECPYHPIAHIEDGRSGEITGIVCGGSLVERWLVSKNHQYWVAFDEPGDYISGTFAACELELLDPTIQQNVPLSPVVATPAD